METQVNKKDIPASEEQYAKARHRFLISIFTLVFVDILLFVGGGVLGALSAPEDVDRYAGIWFMIAVALNMLGMLYFVWLVFELMRLKEAFWKELASSYGYSFQSKPYFLKDALVFTQGHSKRTGYGVVGVMQDVPFRLFEYSYTIGSGKNQTTYSYTVFEFTFSGSFPHIFFNNMRNRALSGARELFLPEVGLPAAFSGKAKLYAPTGYEVEALEIFTPEVLSLLLEEKWPHDMEFVDKKLYVFSERTISRRADLETELERSTKLLSLLTPRLSRMTLAPIGDMKHSL